MPGHRRLGPVQRRPAPRRPAAARSGPAGRGCPGSTASARAASPARSASRSAGVSACWRRCSLRWATADSGRSCTASSRSCSPSRVKVNRLVTSRRLSVSAGSNARSTPASTGACAGRHPVRAGRVGHQDLLQVIDDQQQRPLPALAGLGARPGQQVDQHRLDRLRPLPHLRQPGLDQLPGGRVGADRRGDRVQDGQRPVIAEHHRHRVVRAAGRRSGRPGWTCPAAPARAAAPRPAHRTAAPAAPAAAPGGGPRTSPPPPPAPAACGPGTSWCRGWPSPATACRLPATSGPPPAGPSHNRARCQSARTTRVLRFQQHPAGIADRHRQVGPVGQAPVQPLGEHRGRPVDRPTRPSRSPPGTRPPPAPSPANAPPARPAARAGLALVAVARRQVTGRVGAGRGQARRHEQQPRHRRQQAHQVRGRRRAAAARVVFHQQHRDARLAGPGRPVVQPVARQVHHRHPAQRPPAGAPAAPGRRCPRPAGRRGSRRPRPGSPPPPPRSPARAGPRGEDAMNASPSRNPSSAGRSPGRAQPPHHAEPGQLILGQEPATRPGQQLKRRPQHRPRPHPTATAARRPRTPAAGPPAPAARSAAPDPRPASRYSSRPSSDEHAGIASAACTARTYRPASPVRNSTSAGPTARRDPIRSSPASTSKPAPSTTRPVTTPPTSAAESSGTAQLS